MGHLKRWPFFFWGFVSFKSEDFDFDPGKVPFTEGHKGSKKEQNDWTPKGNSRTVVGNTLHMHLLMESV